MEIYPKVIIICPIFDKRLIFLNKKICTDSESNSMSKIINDRLFEKCRYNEKTRKIKFCFTKVSLSYIKIYNVKVFETEFKSHVKIV